MEVLRSGVNTKYGDVVIKGGFALNKVQLCTLVSVMCSSEGVLSGVLVSTSLTSGYGVLEEHGEWCRLYLEIGSLGEDQVTTESLM